MGKLANSYVRTCQTLQSRASDTVASDLSQRVHAELGCGDYGRQLSGHHRSSLFVYGLMDHVRQGKTSRRKQAYDFLTDETGGPIGLEASFSTGHLFHGERES
jgi:hypothetical protein